MCSLDGDWQTFGPVEAGPTVRKFFLAKILYSLCFATIKSAFEMNELRQVVACHMGPVMGQRTIGTACSDRRSRSYTLRTRASELVGTKVHVIRSTLA
jgi:hypothetical protein